MDTNLKIAVGAGVAGVAILVGLWWGVCTGVRTQTNSPLSVTSFAECVGAGNKVQESYPARCVTKDGTTFTQIITVTEETEPPHQLPNQDASGEEKFEPVVTPTGSPFGHPLNYTIGSQNFYVDGLVVTLAAIADSRCPADAQCIWAGELSPTLNVKGGGFGTTTVGVQLGTMQNRSVSTGGYRFALVETTETTAVIVVEKGVATVGHGYVSGTVTIGPICPVEREGIPCDIASEVYTSRNVVIYYADGTTILKRQALDNAGSYKLTLNPGTYFVQIEPAGIGPGEKKAVTVTLDKTQIVDFDIDTGIR
jgi:hypothetical protein